MSADRVFPSAKPAGAAVNGTTANGTGPTNPAAPTKQPLRPPYRQPYSRRPHRSRRNYCCCCCFWSILIFLILLLLVAIAATALYVLYRPHRPIFSVPSLRIHRLNLTTSADASTNHLSTLLNFTVTSKNPNSHLAFFYDPIVLSAFTPDKVFIGNGTLPGFTSEKQNQTAFKNVVISGSNDLDTESVKSLKSDLSKKSKVSLRIEMDTKVKVKAGKFSSKKIGIRVSCEGFSGELPKGKKSPSVASTDKSKCKVDLRIKIWRFTF